MSGKGKAEKAKPVEGKKKVTNKEDKAKDGQKKVANKDEKAKDAKSSSKRPRDGDGAKTGTAPAATSQIDDIFGDIKKPRTKPKAEPVTTDAVASKKEKKNVKSIPKGDESDDDMGFSKESRQAGAASRKRTAEGFSVYKEDELRMNAPNSGNTPLCPFDCQCCF